MKKYHSHRKRLRLGRWLGLGLVVAVFAVAGTVRYFSLAATFAASSEAEAGTTYTGLAAYCNDSKASGGRSVKFGTNSCDGKVAVSLNSGARYRIYNPSLPNQEYYVNDHAIIHDDATNTWHIIGIQHTAPATCGNDERTFGHGVATSLTAKDGFVRKADAMTALRDGDEDFIWAPHIIRANNQYYMFYAASKGTCTTPVDHNFRIKLATSPDLYTWTRQGTMFTDYIDGRDPFVTKVGDQWVIYYCATSSKTDGNTPIVAYRTSSDLLHWSANRSTALTITQNLVYSESPQVWQRNGIWYMFVGNSYGGNPYNIETVYQSLDPFKWKQTPYAQINTHAGEIVQDTDGKWYMTHSGWNAGGVYLAPLTW